MSFSTINNSITTYFQDIADTHDLVVRYDNDIRKTPSSGLWCKCNVDFDDSKQKEIGVNSYRNTGIFTIEIYYPIKMGLWSILRLVDIIVASFTEEVINDSVKFKTPSIKNIGRIKDNYQMNIICPFYIDN